jgi:N-acetylmuramoyl-L-alanine amidase
MGIKVFWACAFCSLLFNIPTAHALHVILDPGHGGTDRGATRGTISESQITLTVSELVANELKKDGRFKVTLTRTNNTYVSLEERASIANTQGDLFLSIHVNSSSDPKARGHEIYFQNQLPPDQESLYLASRENSNSADAQVARQVSLALKDRPQLNQDVRAIVEDLERNHRLQMSGRFTESLYEHWTGDQLHRRQTIRQAPFFVVSNIDKPAALIEIGYLTNDTESKKLTDTEYQKKVARGIYKAILNFKEVMDKPSPKSLN